MGHSIPQSAIDTYSASPAATTVSSAKSLHESIRQLLGIKYETFLQGSYKNDTGVANINDVDIVALRKSTTSTYYSGITASSFITWEQIFSEIESLLGQPPYYRGKISRGDKCVQVKTNFKADVVPAVNISIDGTDPISIYSFRQQSERQNFPRIHYENNVVKQKATTNTYKATVRLFKKWARNWFPDSNVAPSFYIECLIYNIPDEKFYTDLATSFFMVGYYVTQNINSSSYLPSVAGDKDILVPHEWDKRSFDQFLAALDTSITATANALNATSAVSALNYWRSAFNE